MLKIVKKEDGYWLVIEGEKSAMINLGFPKHIVGEVLEECVKSVPEKIVEKLNERLNIVPSVDLYDELVKIVESELQK